MAIQKVMVVDDSETDRFILTEILEKAGYSVVTANSGDECIERVGVENPDLILMDVIMPGLNGFQTTRKLTKDAATAHIPILMCTGKEQATDRLWAIRQGAKDCVMKPVEAAELLAKVKAQEA